MLYAMVPSFIEGLWESDEGCSLRKKSSFSSVEHSKELLSQRIEQREPFVADLCAEDDAGKVGAVRSFSRQYSRSVISAQEVLKNKGAIGFDQSSALGFRLQGKCFFLIYPRCHLAVQSFIDHFVKSFFVAQIVAVKEAHQDGTPHVHIFI